MVELFQALVQSAIVPVGQVEGTDILPYPGEIVGNFGGDSLLLSSNLGDLDGGVVQWPRYLHPDH